MKPERVGGFFVCGKVGKRSPYARVQPVSLEKLLDARVQIWLSFRSDYYQ
jgi:hypothetical protein